MKGRRIRFEPEELDWIEARKDWARADLHRSFCSFWRRDDVSLANLKALCNRRGWLSGRDGRFIKGQPAANKGKEMSPEARAKCLPTAFKKGNRPHTYRGPGHESIDPKDGYVWLIVAETNPHTGAATRRVQKHRWFWEKENGAIPKGYVLKCLDGDKTNCAPANWEAIPQAMLPKLNGRWTKVRYDEAPADLKPTLMAIAKLDHAARDARKTSK
ncbi:HNH endonuclease signature motif containing protein [Paracoccus sp. IB05]|uniref:HNH endonuclease signature motif containing protein n=1 Tax=Paracoccus sp. IB05 TaxID=2779367 RepID=UPI0018E8E3ED|nr:HNH endonuclease signature motif containing protein [Paracoccus sp. IB05]MBJ2150667.1 HNH endonuclease [Paracoccus sp. IB05]